MTSEERVSALETEYADLKRTLRSVEDSVTFLQETVRHYHSKALGQAIYASILSHIAFRAARSHAQKEQTAELLDHIILTLEVKQGQFRQNPEAIAFTRFLLESIRSKYL